MFILGLIIGIYTGIALMCLFQGNKGDTYERYIK